MRVMFVTHSYPPFGVAGVERVTEQSARSLAAAGHEVTVLSRRITDAPPLSGLDRRRSDDVEVMTITGPRRGLHGPYLDRLEQIFERVLLEKMPDVVVIAHLMDHSPRYVLTAKRWGIPIVMELHDYYQVCERARLERTSGEVCAGPEGGKACEAHCFPTPPQDKGHWAWRTLLYGLALRHADEFVCPSEFVAQLFSGLGVPRARINVIECALPQWMGRSSDPAVRGPQAAERPLHIATLGTVIPHKGHHVVVEALRKARLSEVRYTVIGTVTRPYADELRQAAREIEGLELRMYGAYERELLPALLEDVDLVVVPSVWRESFSIVVREALACGVPVAASRMGALAEAVREGGNGLLFAPGSGRELAVMLQRVDEDRSLLQKLRSGIRSSDWIDEDERRQALEEVMTRVIRKRSMPTARDALGVDLEAVRVIEGIR